MWTPKVKCDLSDKNIVVLLGIKMYAFHYVELWVFWESTGLIIMVTHN